MPVKDIVPAINSGTTSEKPCGTSYEIIWAADRRPPRSENLLFEAQPPRMMPYTPMVAMATTKSRPTLTSVMNQLKAPVRSEEGPKGITEKITSAGPTTRQGAITKAHRTARSGMMSCLTRSFATSASGCRMPQGPTRFGPVLTWRKPRILRSAKVV